MLGICLLWRILWPIFNKIIKFSKSITYFRNRTMLFCNLFIYHLPPSVILSVNEDSFWNLSWSGKVPFLHFNTFLFSRHAFVKNGMQCSKLQSLSHRFLNFVLRNKEQVAFSHWKMLWRRVIILFIDNLFIYGHGYVSFSFYAYMHLIMETCANKGTKCTRCTSRRCICKLNNLRCRKWIKNVIIIINR